MFDIPKEIPPYPANDVGAKTRPRINPPPGLQSKGPNYQPQNMTNQGFFPGIGNLGMIQGPQASFAKNTIPTMDAGVGTMAPTVNSGMPTAGAAVNTPPQSNGMNPMDPGFNPNLNYGGLPGQQQSQPGMQTPPGFEQNMNQMQMMQMMQQLFGQQQFQDPFAGMGGNPFLQNTMGGMFMGGMNPMMGGMYGNPMMGNPMMQQYMNPMMNPIMQQMMMQQQQQMMPQNMFGLPMGMETLPAFNNYGYQQPGGLYDPYGNSMSATPPQRQNNKPSPYQQGQQINQGSLSNNWGGSMGGGGGGLQRNSPMSYFPNFRLY